MHRYWRAVALGLLALGGSLLPLHFRIATFTLSFNWAFCFPLVAALAYGPRHALIAAALGALAPFVVWPSNGWANLLSTFLFFGWFAWQGGFAARRRDGSPWWTSPFVVQAPYCLVFAAGIMGLYPIALACNPAPWEPGSVTSMPAEILGAIAAKEAIFMYLAVLVASCLVRSPRVRRLLALPVPRESRDNDAILALSVAAAGLLFVCLQALETLLVTRSIPRGVVDMATPEDVLACLVIFTGGFATALPLMRFVERRNQAEDALAESRDSYAQVVSSISACVWTQELDDDHRPSAVYFSEVAERLFGVREGTLERSWDACDPFVPAEEKPGLRRFLGQAAAQPGRRHFHEYRIVRADGESRVVVSTAVAHHTPTGRLKIFGTTEDVTDKRLLERQVAQQQKLEGVGLLAGGIAHDFSNMLTPILGYADLIGREAPPDSRMQTRARAISRAASKARDLVRQLLTFSRKQMLSAERRDLNAIVRGFEEIMRRTIPERIRIDIALSEAACPIVADATQIEQVLLNLAVNAQQAVTGMGTIRLETSHVVIDDEYCDLHPGVGPGLYVRLAFSDTGCGIEPDTLPHIFEPFFTTRGASDGTGLGLSTVYGIIKQHDGFLDVASEPGIGTTFHVHLPQRSGEAGSADSGAVRAPDTSRGGRVLLVEDNHLVLDIVKELLESHGFRVHAVDNPVEALEWCDRGEPSLDLLLSDVVMPHMTGPELYEQIKARHPGLRVVFMSGYTGNAEMPRMGSEDGTAFISKPFTSEDLLATIETLHATPAP